MAGRTGAIAFAPQQSTHRLEIYEAQAAQRAFIALFLPPGFALLIFEMRMRASERKRIYGTISR